MGGNQITLFRRRDLTNLFCISPALFNPSYFNLSETQKFSQNKPALAPPPSHVMFALRKAKCFSR